jgi:hypothetical protein
MISYEERISRQCNIFEKEWQGGFSAGLGARHTPDLDNPVFATIIRKNLF